MKIYSAAKAVPIIIENHSFCFTGRAKIKRACLAAIVTERGGTVQKYVTRNTDYLVVGGKGNVRWKYGEYGNKTARAKYLNAGGYAVCIISEETFWEAIDNITLLWSPHKH